MSETMFYKPIGRWLIEEKGCQRNEYSHGVLYETEVLGRRIDVIGLKYEIKPYSGGRERIVDFYGYIVEVKPNQEPESIYSLIGEIEVAMLRFKDRNLPSGFHYIYPYVAVPGETVCEDLIRYCKDRGVGLLRLEIKDEQIYVYEVIEARPLRVVGIPHSGMRSPGDFEDEIRKYPHLLKFLRNQPDEFFEGLLRVK